MSTSDELKSACEELGALIRPHVRPFVSAERIDLGTARHFSADNMFSSYPRWLDDMAAGFVSAILAFPEHTVSLPLDKPKGVKVGAMYHDPESGLHIRGIAVWMNNSGKVVQRFDILLAKPI